MFFADCTLRWQILSEFDDILLMDLISLDILGSFGVFLVEGILLICQDRVDCLPGSFAVGVVLAAMWFGAR